MTNSKKNIKLIAFDLDGTLLTESKELTPRTRKILEQYSDRGVQLVVCTGRALAGVPDEVKSLRGCNYFITANGAGVYRRDGDDFSLVAQNPINDTTVRKLMRELSAYEVMPDPFIDGRCYIYEDKTHLIDLMDVNDAMKDYIRSSRTPVKNMDVFLSDKKVQKITINFATGTDGHRIHLSEVKKVLENYPELVAVTGGIKNIEVSSRKATKGDALSELVKALGIELSEVVAFGDSENDITMLEMAGIGVAMANSLDITIEVADDVTSSNDDDGVAAYLEKLH